MQQDRKVILTTWSFLLIWNKIYKNTQFKFELKSELEVIQFLPKKKKKRRRKKKTLKTTNNILATKWHLMQKEQNADTILLHSHDDVGLQVIFDLRM